MSRLPLYELVKKALLTPEQRRVAIVIYNPQFAAVQAAHDPIREQIERLKAAHDRARVRVEEQR